MFPPEGGRMGGSYDCSPFKLTYWDMYPICGKIEVVIGCGKRPDYVCMYQMYLNVIYLFLVLSNLLGFAEGTPEYIYI